MRLEGVLSTSSPLTPPVLSLWLDECRNQCGTHNNVNNPICVSSFSQHRPLAPYLQILLDSIGGNRSLHKSRLGPFHSAMSTDALTAEETQPYLQCLAQRKLPYNLPWTYPSTYIPVYSRVFPYLHNTYVVPLGGFTKTQPQSPISKLDSFPTHHLT